MEKKLQGKDGFWNLLKTGRGVVNVVLKGQWGKIRTGGPQRVKGGGTTS